MILNGTIVGVKEVDYYDWVYCWHDYWWNCWCYGNVLCYFWQGRGLIMIREFLNELNNLQDKYGIYIDADYKEDWDYGWDGEDEYQYLAGVDPYVVFMNKGGYEIQGIYKDENLHYHI